MSSVSSPDYSGIEDRTLSRMNAAYAHQENMQAMTLEHTAKSDGLKQAGDAVINSIKNSEPKA